ncbi:hypothetical protein, partial [Bacillus spizizenii]
RPLKAEKDKTILEWIKKEADGNEHSSTGRQHMDR